MHKKVKSLILVCLGTLSTFHAFFISNNFISNARLKLAIIQAKTKQHPEAELLANMSKKQVCLYQWDFMINCYENENDNGKVDHLNKTNINEDVDKETSIGYIVCLG